MLLILKRMKVWHKKEKIIFFVNLVAVTLELRYWYSVIPVTCNLFLQIFVHLIEKMYFCKKINKLKDYENRKRTVGQTE